jgi:hypothetical protein
VRVCFHHEADAWSGSARAFADAALALSARGYEVTMSCGEGTGTERQWRASGLDVVALSTAGAWWRRAWALRGVLARRFVEVVFVHSEREQLVAAAGVRLAGRGAVVRRVPPDGHLTLGSDARLAGRLAATGFLFASADDLRAAKPPWRALEPVVAPPAAREAGPRPAPREGGEAVSIAGLFGGSPAQATDMLRTVALLAGRHPELRLALVGPAAGDDALRLQAAALGIAGLIARTVEPSERAAVLARATLACVLADGDDAACALLDCFSAGVPVIAPRDRLTMRFVSDDVNGVIAPSRDPAARAALIASLLADAPRMARLAAGARESAGRWPLKAMADGFEQAASAARDRSRWRA